ncbi:TPA: hypothetical protein PC537_003306 [Morganella morganii]|nr:hypothetical protein [Morganella morganii]
MIITKTLNLGKHNFLKKLSDTNISSNANDTEYFHLGYPINPLSLRGSIVVRFNLNFLSDNEQSFIFGSPIDTGSIKYNFITSQLPIDEFISNVSCDYKKFYSLCMELKKLSTPELDNILHHSATYNLNKIIDNYFIPEVSDVIKKSTNPHSRLFEVCLDGNFHIKKEHISSIYIPNTYCDTLLLKKITKIYSRRVFYYNPKYGMDVINYE